MFLSMAKKALEVWRKWGWAITLASLLFAGYAIQYGMPRFLGARYVTLEDLQALFYGSAMAFLIWGLFALRLTVLSMLMWGAMFYAFFHYAEIAPTRLHAYDHAGHLKYVRLVADLNELPQPNDCFVCYHPPLYYILAAGVYRVARITPYEYPNEEVQLFTTFLFGIIAMFFLALLESTVRVQPIRILPAALILFLPMTIVNSGRVGNDAMSFALWMAGLYFTARWEERCELKYMLAAATTIGLGFLTKLSAAVPAAATVFAAITVYLRFPERRKHILEHMLPCMALFSVTIFVYLHWSHAFIRYGVTANVDQLNGNLYIDPYWKNQFLPEWRSFLHEFARPSNNSGGRQFFWNYWLKTGLCGEWTYTRPHAYYWIYQLARFELVFIGVFFFMCVRGWRDLRVMPSVLLWTVVVSPMFSFGYWWTGHFSPMGDARYVYPGFLAVAVVFGRLMDGSWEMKRWFDFALGLAAAGAFIWAGYNFEMTQIF